MERRIAGNLEPSLPKQNELPEHEHEHEVVLTSPQAKDVTLTQRYVCQIHSQRHIKMSALSTGYLEEILVKEGQRVKKGDVMFKVVPTVYKAKRDAMWAEAKLAQLEYSKSKKLSSGKPGEAGALRMMWRSSRPNWRGPGPTRSWRRPNWILPP